MVLTRKFSEFTDSGDIENDNITVGLDSGVNAQFNNPWNFLAEGSTGDRPTPAAAMYYRLRFNTTTEVYEYYDPTIPLWTQLSGTGTGTVNPGNTNDIAFYGSNGQVISPIAAAASSVLVTDAGEIPTLSTTLPTGITIPSATITSSTAALTSGSVVAAPVAGTDITNKDYVDTLIGGAAGGVNGNIQYNNAGGFGGDASFNTDGGGNIDIVGSLSVDNIDINGNAITSTDTNGDVAITPNGTGDLVLDGLKWPQADGVAGYVLSTDGFGQLSWSADAAAVPGGISGQMQYNNAGAFGGDTGFTTDGVGNISLVSLDIGASTVINGFIDDDSFATASATTGATSESIKAYVDAISPASTDGQTFSVLLMGG